MVYEDNTPLPFGRYKFTRICAVPSKYLLDFYKLHKPKGEYKDLCLYIENNLERILSPDWGIKDKISTKIICPSGKISYISKKVANLEMNRIRGLIGEGGLRPVRSYECKLCSFWHLTSSTKEEYEEKVEIYKNKDDKV